LGQEKATEVTKKALDSYQARFADYKPTANWINDKRCEIGFSVKGMSLKGVLEVNPSSIEMDLDVPFILKPFKGKALGVIEDEIRGWIGKAKAGQI
jgi:hypothetical protein